MINMLRLAGGMRMAVACSAPMRAAMQAGLLDWAKYFLPEHFVLAPSEMHRWVAERIGQMQIAECRMQNGDGENPNSSFCNLHSALTSKLNLVGPRGSAKSTVVTLAHVLREALEGRQPYIWIVCDTKRQAGVHLANIKTELLTNKRLAMAYPTVAGQQGPMWQASAIVLPNGVKIEAIGSGQPVRGLRWREHRPTLIVCDDLQNDRHIHSPQQRERDRAWFHGMVMKAGGPETQFIHLGTALHRECLAMELDKTPGWTSRVFRSIVEWPTNMGKWAEWEALYVQGSGDRNQESATCTAGGAAEGVAHGSQHAPRDETMREGETSREDKTEVLRTPFHHAERDDYISRAFYDAHRAEMDAGARILWPERESLYSLMCMRAESGRATFDREKQSVPMHPELCEWPEKYFGDEIWFDEWPKDLKLKTLALDPSKGTDAKRGDYSAFVMLGIAKDDTMFIEADLARRPTPDIVADGVELCRRFKPHALAIEENQCRDLLGIEFTRALRADGQIGLAPHTIDNRINKLVRIRRLGPLLAQKQLRFRARSPGTQLLVEQLKSFPTADHDDGPDALEMAIRLMDCVFAGEVRVRR
jgi:predicted phage terminase large subunit-like protein